MHYEVKSLRQPKKARRSLADRMVESIQEIAGGKARIIRHSEKNWASITFAGTRHRFEMAFEGEEAVEAGECFIAFLPEHEFAIPGQLIADAAITEVDHIIQPPALTVTCELLMVEEG